MAVPADVPRSRFDARHEVAEARQRRVRGASREGGRRGRGGPGRGADARGGRLRDGRTRSPPRRAATMPSGGRGRAGARGAPEPPGRAGPAPRRSSLRAAPSSSQANRFHMADAGTRLPCFDHSCSVSNWSPAEVRGGLSEDLGPDPWGQPRGGGDGVGGRRGTNHSDGRYHGRDASSMDRSGVLGSPRHPAPRRPLNAALPRRRTDHSGRAHIRRTASAPDFRMEEVGTCLPCIGHLRGFTGSSHANLDYCPGESLASTLVPTPPALSLTVAGSSPKHPTAASRSPARDISDKQYYNSDQVPSSLRPPSHDYDERGRCVRHPEVRLRRKNILTNSWKVLSNICPRCHREELSEPPPAEEDGASSQDHSPMINPNEYDAQGRCVRHPHVRLRTRRVLGGWKARLSACPECCKAIMAELEETYWDLDTASFTKSSEGSAPTDNGVTEGGEGTQLF